MSFWDYFSRWRSVQRTLPVRSHPDAETYWLVVNEAGNLAPEPFEFPDTDEGARRAQQRADDLNREEHYAALDNQ